MVKMSEFKISFNLLKQQIDELKNVATQMQSLAERANTAGASLGQDELLAQARQSISQTTFNIGATAELLSIASATLGEIIEQYTGTEKQNVTQAEGTKAHSRDFYKNPVSISEGMGDTIGSGINPGMGGATSGDYVMSGAEMGSNATAAGAAIGADAAVSGAAAAVSGVETGAAAVMGGVEAGASAGLGGVALGAGVAVAGAAAGVGGVVGGKKLNSMLNDKKEKEEKEVSDETVEQS